MFIFINIKSLFLYYIINFIKSQARKQEGFQLLRSRNPISSFCTSCKIQKSYYDCLRAFLNTVLDGSRWATSTPENSLFTTFAPIYYLSAIKLYQSRQLAIISAPICNNFNNLQEILFEFLNWLHFSKGIYNIIIG